MLIVWWYACLDAHASDDQTAAAVCLAAVLWILFVGLHHSSAANSSCKQTLMV